MPSAKFFFINSTEPTENPYPFGDSRTSTRGKSRDSLHSEGEERATSDQQLATRQADTHRRFLKTVTCAKQDELISAMAFVNPYIRRSLRSTPIVIERLVAQLPDSALDDRPDPERFTIREVLCHLADWEPFFLERLKGAATVDNFQITAYDEGQLAIDHDYAHQDLRKALERYKGGRETYIAYAESLPPEALDRPAYHPEQGPLTAGDLINIVVGHDVYHIEQISARL